MVERITEHDQTESYLWLAQQIGSVPCLGSAVAHDLVNYLAVAYSYVSLLLMDADPDGRTHRVLTETARAVQTSTLLARRLLHLNRTGTRCVQELCIRVVIAGMESMLRRLIGPDVELIVSCAPDAGLVQADPQEIERVLLNLVVNARQAIAGQGTITLRVTNAWTGESEGQETGSTPYVAISVRDTGIGMAEETRARVFEPFFTTKKGGTGIGLAIVHDIVARSHGHVRVESQLGHGTTFTVLLPSLADKTKERCAHGQDA